MHTSKGAGAGIPLADIVFPLAVARLLSILDSHIENKGLSAYVKVSVRDVLFIPQTMLAFEEFLLGL